MCFFFEARLSVRSSRSTVFLTNIISLHSEQNGRCLKFGGFAFPSHQQIKYRDIYRKMLRKYLGHLEFFRDI